MKTTYNQIVDVDQIASHVSTENIDQLIVLAKNEKTADAANDKKRTLLLAIDFQNDFMENIGTLPVSGSKKDVENLTRWMYNNIEHLTQVMCSLDTHSINQIFHANWWTDAKDNAPAPFTVITYKDAVEGKWKSRNNNDQERSLTYLKQLEQTGKQQLCIWPYHCLEGTLGAKLESQFLKMIYFHSALRNISPILVAKGQDPYSEMYGIIEPEYNPQNKINQNVLDTIETFDAIFVAGEASSHCVMASVVQILNYFANRKDITSRITILSDCMSAISGSEETTRLQFEELKEKYGIQIKKSTEIKL